MQMYKEKQEIRNQEIRNQEIRNQKSEIRNQACLTPKGCLAVWDLWQAVKSGNQESVN